MSGRSIRTLALASLSLIALAGPATAVGERVEESWARYLFDLMPAIDACVTASPEPASVLTAWPMNQGMVGMRLVDVVGAHWTCVAEATGVSVDSFEPAEIPPEPSPEPVFTPAPGAPPPGVCYEHEEVEDAGGEVVGWLSFHIC